MNQKIKETYLYRFGKRYSRKDKRAAQQQLVQDFEELGYKSEVIKKRVGISQVEHLIVGNIKQAKNVILVPFNTPARVFWFKNDFYPQDGYQNMKKMFLPTYAPMLIGYLGLLGFVYLLPLLVKPQILGYFYPLALLYLGLLMLFVFKGYPNKHNVVRNSASIALALELANGLTPAKRKEVLFVFVDGNKNIKSIGNASVTDYLIDHNKRNMNIIDLYCLGKPGAIRIAHDKNTKGLAKDLLKEAKGGYPLTSVSIDENGKYNTTLENLQRCLMISSGEMTNKGLCVKGVATSKDKELDELIVDEVREILRRYLSKK